MLHKIATREWYHQKSKDKLKSVNLRKSEVKLMRNVSRYKNGDT